LDGEILRGDPENLSYRNYLGNVLDDLGEALRDSGEDQKALAAFREAIEHQCRTVDKNPAHRDYREDLGWHYLELASVQRKLGGPAEAAAIANDETSGLAAGIVARDAAAAAEFLHGYAGTGAFWNATTRLLDGFKLLSVPETGINIDPVPGPRGPVTFRDLHLRQFVVTPVVPGR